MAEMQLYEKIVNRLEDELQKDYCAGVKQAIQSRLQFHKNRLQQLKHVSQ
ncbi:hypothetical protein LC040_02525 [Bacillus tianshenii]|nr:hypothetical protein LC040_02525 [Bacillus tianshenii]